METLFTDENAKKFEARDLGYPNGEISNGLFRKSDYSRYAGFLLKMMMCWRGKILIVSTQSKG